MTVPGPARLVALTVDAENPAGLAAFWAGLLDGTVVEDPFGGPAVLPAGDPGFRMRFQAGAGPKSGPNQYHFDLTSTSLEDQRQRVARALVLGGRHHDVGQGPEVEHVVLADPEGNELCVIEPGNRFLEGCGLVGALSGDGSAAVGRFWSRTLGWPLVWDQDEETAVQAPTGGPKITWGGPPYREKDGKERWHLDLVPADGADLAATVDALIALGATRADIGQGDVPWVVLADPDGHEFCVHPEG